MIGLAFYRLLFNASIHFALHPDASRYGWIDQATTVRGLKRAFRSSVYISGEIRNLGPKELFEWVRRNDSSQRYGFIRAIRTGNVKALPPGLGQDNFDFRFADLSYEAQSRLNSAQQNLTGQANQFGGESLLAVDAKNSRKLDSFLDYFIPLDIARTRQPDSGRIVEEQFRDAKPDNNARPVGELEVPPVTVVPTLAPPPVPIVATAAPNVAPIVIQRNGFTTRASSVFRQVASATNLGPSFKWVVSKGEILFNSQIVNRIGNFMSRFTNGSESRQFPGVSRAASVGGRAALGAGRAAGAVGQGALWAARGLTATGPVGWGIGAGVLIVSLVGGFLLLYQPILKSQTFLVYKADGMVDLGTPGGIGGGGGSCPSQAVIDANKDAATCRYLSPGISLTDTNISDTAVQSYIDKYTPTFVASRVGDAVEFKRRVAYIISQSKKAGLNPAIFLGYWKSESLFSTDPETTADLGCAPGQGRKAFEIEVDCAVGLTPEGGALASRCASPVITNKAGCTKPMTTFDQFVESYGSAAVDPNNCSHTYNILLEVANELNVCKAGQGGQVSAPPASADQQQLHNEILNKFGVDMDVTLPYEYLKWAWEKLWNVSNTRFIQLVRGPQNTIIKISRSDGPYNEKISCSSIVMSGKSSATQQPYPEPLFKVVFIHELSHIIEDEACNSANSGFDKLKAAIPSQENYLTSYSQNSLACAVTRTENIKEDYAESISYFLNPEFPEQDIGLCASFKPQDNLNPYNRSGSAIHRQIISEVLGSVDNSRTSNSGLAQFSCPVVGGNQNRLASYQADPINGHCGVNYKSRLTEENGEDVSDCTGDWRRAKSVDIETGGPAGKDIELPTIDGKSVDWKYVDKIELSKGDCFAEEIVDKNGVGGGCGVGYVFQTDLGGGKNWVLHLLHLQKLNLQTGQIIGSGTVIGKSQAIHTHISIGQNIQNVLSQIDNGSPGWLSADTQLHICGS